MGLANKIKSDSVQAMKDKNQAKLSTLRLLISELEKEKVSLKLEDVSNLSDDKVVAVVSRQIKKLDTEIEAYVNAGREVDSQNAEKDLLQSYLPKQATDDEIRELAYHADSLTRKGEIRNPMQYLSQRLRGKADMKKVSEIVREVQKELDNSQ